MKRLNENTEGTVSRQVIPAHGHTLIEVIEAGAAKE